MRRVVKPPPRVNPQLPSSHYSPSRNDAIETIPYSTSHQELRNDPEFEAMVQREMDLLRSEMASYSQQNDYEPPLYSFDQPDYSRQKYPPPVQNSIDIPKKMYESSVEPYPGLFDSPNHSLSPRRTKGDLHDLYGPDDDRQNLKAAKAAAYSHQLEQQRQHRLQSENYSHPKIHPDYSENSRERDPDYRHTQISRDHDLHFPSKVSPIKSDSSITSQPRANNFGTGLPLGRSDLDEKALRRQRQLEYKRQLDAQNQLRLQNKHDDEVSQNSKPNHSTTAASDHPHPSRYPEADRLKEYQHVESNIKRPQESHPYRIPEDDDYPQRRVENYSIRREDNDAMQNPHRSHLKGVVGKVNMESQDVDKSQRKKQQEEYRRQLDLQAKADLDRKEREKQEREDYFLIEGQSNTAQADGQSFQSKISRSEILKESQIPESNHSRVQKKPQLVEATSPGRSPTKARNRLLTDVYGGFSLGGGAEEPVGKISMRGMDSNDAKKKAAIREQQRALEQQIEEKRRLKEMEKEKNRLEEEKIARYEVEKERERNIHTKQTSQVQDVYDEQENTRKKLEMAAQHAAREKLQHQKNQIRPEESWDEDRGHESPNRSKVSSTPSSSTPKRAPRPPPPTNPLLEEFGNFDDNQPNQKSKPNHHNFSEHSRQIATPGGSLEQESQLLPIPDSDNQRESYREDRYRSYRQNIDEEDKIVVDWQHHRGYSTKRGTTPRKLEESNRKKNVPADPWAPGGLLSLLTGKSPPRDKRVPRDDASIIEKSLVGDSLLMFLDVPPPSRGGEKRMTQVSEELSNSLNSPLSSFVNSHSNHRQQKSSPTKSPHRSVIPTRYDPRLSDDQLEKLITQSKANIVSNLLLDGDDRSHSNGPQYIDPSRPLTSAGRKLTSRDPYYSKKESNEDTEQDEILIIPSSKSDSTLNPRDKVDSLLNRSDSFRVQSVSEDEKRMMMEMMQNENRTATTSRPTSKAGNSRPTSSASLRHESLSSRSQYNDITSRPTSRHSDSHSSKSISTPKRRPESGKDTIDANPKSVSRPSSRYSDRQPTTREVQTPNSRPSSRHSQGSRPSSTKKVESNDERPSSSGSRPYHESPTVSARQNNSQSRPGSRYSSKNDVIQKSSSRPSSQPSSQPNSRQLSRSKWEISDSSKQMAVLSLRNNQNATDPESYQSNPYDDGSGYQEEYQDYDDSQYDYNYHDAYDSQTGEEYEQSSYDYPPQQSSYNIRSDGDGESFYGMQYDENGEDTEPYVDQVGNLIDPILIAEDEQIDRNERTMNQSDLLRNLAM